MVWKLMPTWLPSWLSFCWQWDKGTWCLIIYLLEWKLVLLQLQLSLTPPLVGLGFHRAAHGELYFSTNQQQ